MVAQEVEPMAYMEIFGSFGTPSMFTIEEIWKMRRITYLAV